MQVAVLGPMVVRVDGEPVDLGPRKQRALLAALVLHHPRAVSVDALTDFLWGDEAPPAAVSSMHGYVARLRRVLEPRRGARTPAAVLVTAEPGYALRVADADIDVTRFVSAAEGVHRRLADVDRLVPAAPAAITRAELAELAAQLDEAMALWRGEPYAELADHTVAVTERSRLLDLYLIASEDQALIRTELGEHATAAAQLGALAHHHPLRERLWALWALALARADRQADALAALRQVRGVLVEELGVDPGDSLRAVEAAVLAQDARVLRPAPRGPGVPAPANRRDGDHPRSSGAAESAQAGGDRTITATGVAHDAGRAWDVSEDPQRWPLIDRDSELDRLTALLGQVSSGRTRFALLVGEPGIGKSRLIDEFMRQARVDGFGVFVGRCSADEGAPPLWPWLGALRELRAGPDAEAVRDLSDVDRQVLDDLSPTAVPSRSEATATGSSLTVESERFQIAEAVRRLLAAVAARRPVLVVLEDLHWADRSSLRLLRHLAETLVDAGVLLLASRRAHPEPDGVLADAGEVLARRHALRLDLAGLSDDGVSRLVAAVTGHAATSEVVTSLRTRTDGNPFFLVELVRLLADAPADVAQRAEIPAAVSDVVSARVARLPEQTREVLQTAAVLGREWAVGDLSAALDHRVEAVLDVLDPATDAGIIAEESRVGWFRFSHALVRDVLYQAQTGTRRARRHAAAAAALGQRGPDRLSETARHWLAAGPMHAAVAWQCAAQAARQAQRLRGYEEAAELLAAAVAAQADDRDCGPVQRYDLLMAHADACRFVGDRDGQLEALDRAGREADALGDIERLARAAVTSADGSLWTIRGPGIVHEPAVTALRRAVRDLPPGDSDLRCRVLLTLSGELHYANAPRERDALADEGLAMAQRIGDPSLRAWAAATAFVATWASPNAEARWHMVDQAIASGEAADQVFHAHLVTLRAIAGLETGRIDAMLRDHGDACERAQRLRLPFTLLVLANLELPWLAMQGRFDDAQRLVEQTARMPVPVHPRDLLDLSAQLYVRMWQGQAAELLPRLRAGYAALPGAYAPLYLLALAHAEQDEEARAVIDDGVALLPQEDSWSATFDLAVVAHLAYLTGHAGHASTAYELLARYAGRPATTGSAGAVGPVDAYLALAAVATGERDIARRHADDAAALAAKWEIPVFARWLADLRDRGRF